MELIQLFLFISHLSSLFAGTTIRFNIKGNHLLQKRLPSNVKPFYVPPSSSPSESALPTILLAGSLASSMMTDALILHKELHEKYKADRRDSVMSTIKTGLGNAADSIGSRLDMKSGLNNLFDKFQPLWGRQPTFGSMLSDITNTKPNEVKSFQLPASIAEKLGTSSMSTSSSSYSASEPATSGSSQSSKWVNPFVTYPTAKSQPAKQGNTPAPTQTTPAPVASSIRHQVVMPFASPGQTLPSGYPPYPYANAYPGYASQYYRPGMHSMSASNPYAVVVPPPSQSTTPPPQIPKTPRTIVIEEDEDEEEGGESGKGGEISIGGIQATQMLKGAAQVIKGVAASTGVNLGNVMQTMITTAVTSVAAGLAAARPGQPSNNVPHLFQAPTPFQQYTPQSFIQPLQPPSVHPQYPQQTFQHHHTQTQAQPVQQQQMTTSPQQQQQYQPQQPTQQAQQQQQTMVQSQQQPQINQQAQTNQQPTQQQQQQQQTSSTEADPLKYNPKSKDEVFDDGDEEVIVIRRPKLKPKQPPSSTSIVNFPQQTFSSNPFIDEVPQMSLPAQSAIDLQTLASQFSSLVSSAAAAQSQPSPSSSDQKEGSKDKSSQPYIKIGESKISFKPTSEGLSISFGRD